ncbi:TRAP transporter substrate-binding protein DctP [Magnetospirillum sulfuroxidans]|uniref:TRAP transporter substrate-binding protein DctP n=1 Tax=Magnetospirillum sulfuroxidans TaxID=611300 RepID=A0ABS5IEK3_9PROT|nr:TRAP transporter substrate-binding protein DctP [Magnetospirillum sulfuroxidans]MBR9972188.1 TRAP transporter substrate-binding protein DctP [Magnetospirillum sulfuroxidans]
MALGRILCFAAALLAALPALAQPVQIFLAHAQPQNPENDPVAAVAEEFRRLLAEKSQGRLEVEIVAESLLGGNRDMTNLVAKGVIHSALVTVGGVTPLYPPLMTTQLPFAFNRVSDARNVLDGPFGQDMAADMAARTKLTLLGFADPGGFHVLTNFDRDIVTPDDMWGLRLRAIPGFAPLDAMITAVNARPVQVSSRDELAMLSAGAIDGQMSPSAVILARNFDMAQHHATLLDALYSPYVWLFNSAKLKALSAADAQAVREAASAALKKGRALVDTMDQSERGRSGLAKRMQVRTLSAAERQAFRQTMQPPVEEAIIQALADDHAWMEKFKAALPSIR